jgi:PAS domain S-box-containing protein
MWAELSRRVRRLYRRFEHSLWSDLFPNSTVALFFLTMAVMLWTLDTREADQLRTDLSRDTLWAEQSSQRRLDDSRQQLSELAHTMGNHQLREKEFTQQATTWLATMPEMVAINYADASGEVQLSQPVNGGPYHRGQLLSFNQLATFKKSEETGRTNFSLPYPGPTGEWFIDLSVPIYNQDQFAGVIIGTFSANTLVQRLPPTWLGEKYQLELTDSAGRLLARNTNRPQIVDMNEIISLPGSGLFIRVRPIQGVVSPARKLQLGLIIGLTLLTLASLASLNSHIRRRIAAEADRDRVFRLSQELLAVVNEETVITEANPAFERILGYLPERLVGHSFLDFLPDPEHLRLRQGFQAILAGYWNERYVETRVYTPDGEARDIVWAVSPLPERGLVYLSGRDITAEKQALDAYRRESAFRKAMEDSVIVGIRAIDLYGRITYVNHAFCHITGFSEEELIGQLPPYPFWPEGEASERNKQTLRDTLAGTAPREVFESGLRRKNGETFYAEMLISPLIDETGVHTGWMTVLTDITRQREAEDRYKEQVEKLQATSRLVTLGEMASTLAHELNQPLSAIANYQAGCIERLKQGKTTPDKLLPIMQKITDQAERAGMVVRRIREFVKQSAPDRRPGQLAEIMDATLAIAEIEAKRQGARIEVDLPALPLLLVDPILIEQVLLNLIKNGIEAMHDVPAAYRIISVSAKLANNKRVAVSIADRGHGVPAELKERLFEAFFTTKSDGTGLGLGICRSIVEFHQGQLWVEDRPGGGSIFSFTLPVVTT